MIDWRPIAELPEEFKDGRYVLFSDEEGRPLTAFHMADQWYQVTQDGHRLPIWTLDHFAEINPPDKVDPGIPMYRMRKD